MNLEEKRSWTVNFSTSAKKQVAYLQKEHSKIYAQLALLAKEMEIAGPFRSNWSNFGPLAKTKTIRNNSYHCHIKKGKPTYVVCWRVEDNIIKIIEVFYVGTHEKAPY